MTQTSDYPYLIQYISPEFAVHAIRKPGRFPQDRTADRFLDPA